MQGDGARTRKAREEEPPAGERNPPPTPKVPDPVTAGQQIASTTCIACHSFTPGTASANPLAPNLGHYATEGPFNDPLKALKASGDAAWLPNWVTNAPAIKPRTL